MGVVELLKVAREFDDSCSVQKLQVLCYVAACGSAGTDHQSIQTRVDIGRSHCSRLVADLSDFTADKKEGPGLIKAMINPMDSRHRIISITEKGKEFVNKMLEVRL